MQVKLNEWKFQPTDKINLNNNTPSLNNTPAGINPQKFLIMLPTKSFIDETLKGELQAKIVSDYPAEYFWTGTTGKHPYETYCVVTRNMLPSGDPILLSVHIQTPIVGIRPMLYGEFKSEELNTLEPGQIIKLFDQEWIVGAAFGKVFIVIARTLNLNADKTIPFYTGSSVDDFWKTHSVESSEPMILMRRWLNAQKYDEDDTLPFLA